MNSVPKFAKKTLSSIVVSSTILWSMGASMIVGSLTANAAVTDGTLIKAKEVEAVYYYKGGKRWTFPNLKTYKTWYKDFSSVQVVPLSELQTYPLSGNATYRAGTRLVKITTDPKVYAVEPSGKLRWVKDEATAKALFGDKWNKMVDDVADAFFTNYTVGSDLGTAVYPEGSLVKSGTTYYYIEAGKKRLVDSAALTSNNFNTAYAVTVSDLSAYADGTAMGAAEKTDLAAGAPASTGTGTGTTTSSNGSLTVSLASDSPATGSIVVDNSGGEVGGQRFAKVLKLNLTATGGDVKVTQLTTVRSGISKDADLDQLYIADANGKVLAKNNSFSAGVGVFVNTSGLFTVPAGQTSTIWILEDVNKAASSGTTQGWTVAASGMKIDSTGTISGSATGSMFTVATVTDLGQLEIASSSPLTSRNVDAGKTNFTLGTFEFKAKDQDILVKKLKVTQIGTVAASDLKNIRLEVAGVQFGGTKAQLESDNSLTFDLTVDKDGKANTDGALKILAGQSKFLDIIGDVVGGTNRTFKFSIQNEEDTTAFDNNYKVNVPIHQKSNNSEVTTSADFAVQTLGETSVQTGKLTLSLATDSPNSYIASGGSAVTVGKFTLAAAGENVKISSLSVALASNSGATIDFMTLKNAKLLLDGVQVGSTVTSWTTSTAAAFTFSNNFIVKVGTPSTLLVQADLTDSGVDTDDTIQATLSSGSSNAQGMVSLASIDTTQVSGFTLTVKGGSPTAALNPGLTDATTLNPSGVLNDSGVRIGSFIVSAGSGEGAKLTSIAFQDERPLNGFFTRIALQKDGKDLATSLDASSASSTYTFSLNEPLKLAKGEQATLDVVANFRSTTSSNTLNAAANPVIFLKANGINYQTTDTGQSGTAPSAAVVGQNVFISNSGTLTVAEAQDTPSAQQMVLGSTAQPLAKFKLTAGAAEDIKITELTTAFVLPVTSSPVSGLITGIKLYDGDALKGTVNGLAFGDGVATSTAVNSAYAKFSAIDLQVPKNTSKTITIVGDVSAANSNLSSSSMRVVLTDGYNSGTPSSAIVALGSKSGASVSTAAVPSSGSQIGTSGDLQTSMTTVGLLGGLTAQTDKVLNGAVMAFWRTKLVVSNYNGDGNSYSTSPSTDQVVSRFVISNTANQLGASAYVDLFNPRIDTTISLPAGGTANLTVYKRDPVTETSDRVDSAHTIGAATNLNAAAATSDALGYCTPGVRTSAGAMVAYSYSSCRPYDRNLASEWTSTEIPANKSLIFVVTFTTTNGSPSSKTLNVAIPQHVSALEWSDGYSTNIKQVDTLPLIGKSISYQ